MASDDGNFINVDGVDTIRKVLEKLIDAKSNGARVGIEMEDSLKQAWLKSKRKRDDNLRLRKKQKNYHRNSAIAAILLALVLSGGALLRLSSNSGISIEDKKHIDDIISDSCSDIGHLFNLKISTTPGGDNEFKLDEFKKKLIDAANVSELEFRCVLLGAAKALGCTPFCDNVDKILGSLYGSREQYPSASDLLFTGNSENLFCALGYSSWQEYWENERDAIYKLFLENGLSEIEAKVATRLLDQEAGPNRGGR